MLRAGEKPHGPACFRRQLEAPALGQARRPGQLEKHGGHTAGAKRGLRRPQDIADIMDVDKEEGTRVEKGREPMSVRLPGPEAQSPDGAPTCRRDRQGEKTEGRAACDLVQPPEAEAGQAVSEARLSALGWL